MMPPDDTVVDAAIAEEDVVVESCCATCSAVGDAASDRYLLVGPAQVSHSHIIRYIIYILHIWFYNI